MHCCLLPRFLPPSPFSPVLTPNSSSSTPPPSCLLAPPPPPPPCCPLPLPKCALRKNNMNGTARRRDYSFLYCPMTNYSDSSPGGLLHGGSISSSFSLSSAQRGVENGTDFVTRFCYLPPLNPPPPTTTITITTHADTYD